MNIYLPTLRKTGIFSTKQHILTLFFRNKSCECFVIAELLDYFVDGLRKEFCTYVPLNAETCIQNVNKI